jgi:hypothetical protein
VKPTHSSHQKSGRNDISELDNIYRGANLDPILEKGKERDIRTQEDLT